MMARRCCFSVSTAALFLVLSCVAGTALANTRRDVASAYLACASSGRSFAEVRGAHAPDGVKFMRASPTVIRVGHTRGWVFTRRICELSVGQDGRILSSRRLP